MFDWIYDIGDLFSNVNPVVIGSSLIIWLIVVGMVWKSPMLTDYPTNMKIIFTIVSGPIIYFVFYAISNK